MLSWTQNSLRKYFRKMFPLFILFAAHNSLSAECSSCQINEDCFEVDYVDYKPWETGDDAGLWCLPGSRCTTSLPTRPTGAQIYQDLGHLCHKNRNASEYTPEQWRTIMLHMRVLLPMTAWDYRMVLTFLQGMNPQVQTRTDGSLEKSDKSAVNDDSLDGVDLSLDLATPSTEPMGPVGFAGYKSKFNYVFSGVIFCNYFQPMFSFFGDYKGNNSFFYGFGPNFIVSYGDSILMAAEFAINNFGQQAFFTLPYAYVAYVYNDYITFQCGKIILPFGNLNTMLTRPWIEKCAFPPYCRLGIWPVCADTEIGFEVKGAIPLCDWGDCFSRSSVTYDLWIGNGPSEVNDFSGSSDPNGTINFNVGSGNAPNNNNEFTYGCRLGFLPNDRQLYGISYMRGRWTSNKVAFSADGLGKKRVYEAACFDWNVWFNPSIVFRGEYIWTQYEGNFPGFPWVRQSCYWAQLAFDLDMMRSICPSIYCWKPCLWDSLELVFRSEMTWSQPNGSGTFGFNYDGFDKKTFSICLGYYFTQTFSIKAQYDINYGESALNPVREFVTGKNEKTGFDNNVFIFELVYGF